MDDLIERVILDIRPRVVVFISAPKDEMEPIILLEKRRHTHPVRVTKQQARHRGKKS